VSPSKQRYALDGTPLPVPLPPLLKTLSGRNVLLGPLVEATFTALAAISNHKAIVCSEKGDVCLLDDSEGAKLLKLTNTGFHITCIAIDMDTRRVRIGGRHGIVKSVGLDDLLAFNASSEMAMVVGEATPGDDDGHLCAMGYSARSLITIDSKHSIKISSPDSDEADPKMLNTPFPAHGDAVMGVRLLSENPIEAAFLTWSANGKVVFWGLDGCGKKSLTIEVEQSIMADDDLANQCQVVQAAKGTEYIVTGDKGGVLKVIKPSTAECIFEARAHMSDIQDIALFESSAATLIASCGRDRVVQLFRRVADQWMLIQSLEDHSASVTCLFFAEDGEKLISCSTDRTIHIRQIVKKDSGGESIMGAVPVRIITLKASPVSMAPCLNDGMNNFVVSLLDRTVATFEISSGKLVSSFKVTDADGGDAVVLDALVMGVPAAGRPTILAGISGTDKSVRVYDGHTGGFLDREWGHTAAITDVALLETPGSEQKILISTGSDGTIMTWNLSPKPPEVQEPADLIREPSPPKETASSRPPLRRVLSRAELAEFQRASPVSTPTNRQTSPPRTVRRKTSRYGLSASSPTILPPIPANSKHMSTTDESSSRRGSPRNRSRSPPNSPKATKDMRRPSLASLADRGRTKSTGSGFSEFGSLNMATEQACRTLRAYRKKLLSSESVKDEALKELDQELRLTSMALGEKSLKSKTISETVLTGLLDQYSDRLVSMFDEKLRLTKMESNGSESGGSTEQRPKTAGAAAAGGAGAPPGEGP
jgi:WD40 repeat protein